jgi:hypothetical protein
MKWSLSKIDVKNTNVDLFIPIIYNKLQISLGHITIMTYKSMWIQHIPKINNYELWIVINA